MDHKSDSSVQPVEPDPVAVEERYGDLAADYARSRADAADALGRKDSAQKWRKVEEVIEGDA